MDEQSLRSALSTGPHCPSIEALNARLTGAEGNEARAAAALHLAQCLHCRTEMHLLREFETGAIRPDEAASVSWIAGRLKTGDRKPAVVHSPRKPGFWGLPKLVFSLSGVALAALLAIGISSELRLRDSIARPVPQFNDGIQRSRHIDVVETNSRFEWKPVRGAARYDLSVRTVDGSVVFHNSFTETSLAFPAEVDALVKTGKLLEWEVIAKDPAGNEIARSGVRRLRSPLG